MPFAKRVGDTNNRPNLPLLEKTDLSKKYLTEAAQMASWTPREAACFINESRVIEKIDIQANDPISKIYFWLLKSFDDGVLQTQHYDETGEPLKSPGDYFRTLWENDFYVSLKVWAMYDMFGSRNPNDYITKTVAKDSYINAASIIWKHYPKCSKAQMISILLKMKDEFNYDRKVHVFQQVSEAYLNDILKGMAPNQKSGRRKIKNSISLDKEKNNIINILLSELDC